MLKSFSKDLWLSILAELQNEDHKFKNFFQIVKKTVVIKAKANLQFWATTKDIDQYYPQNSQSANSITAKNQGQLIKNL